MATGKRRSSRRKTETTGQNQVEIAFKKWGAVVTRGFAKMPTAGFCFPTLVKICGETPNKPL
jgi:hypothetical protein